MRGLALLGLLAGPVAAQGWMSNDDAKNWAWDRLKGRTFYLRDAQGQTLWRQGEFTFERLPYAEQNRELLRMLGQGRAARRTALLVLGDRSLADWAKPALQARGDRDEVALFLLAKGYKLPEAKDPWAYLDPADRLERPWGHGIGLHKDGGAWRLQVIPSPALMGVLPTSGGLPKALERAPVPTALARLRQLRSGLLDLRRLAAGPDGIPAALAQGSRLGFLLRHLDPWLDQGLAALGPLAEREAWVMHYGFQRDDMGPSQGTLVWLPGELPARTRLLLELLKLNPSSKGARTRTDTWEHRGHSETVTVLRASGGLLYLWSNDEGTWLSDRAPALKAVLFPEARETFGDRAVWGRVATAGLRSQTDLSLWIIPRFGADATFERVAQRRQALKLAQPTWPNPFVAKAAPRGLALSGALGAGPTEALVQSLLRLDHLGDLPEPVLAAFMEDGKALSPAQKAAYEKDLAQVRARNRERKALRSELTTLMGMLDLRGAALAWNGWTPEPPPGPGKPEQRFGGFAEPGRTPSLALALPAKAGQGAALSASLQRLWPRLFKGQPQKRAFGTAELTRIRTGQAFNPCFAVVADHLVAGSDDKAVERVVAGLLGQAPTLADVPGEAYGRFELDGPALAREVEVLLLAYLKEGGWQPFEGQNATAEEAAAELAATYGPFLGAVKALGRQTWHLASTPAGFELTPR